LRLKVCQVCRWTGRGQGSRSGVEDQRAGAVLVEELACDHRVGGVGGDGGEGVTELCTQFLEPGVVAGDPDDMRAVLGEDDGDGAAESPAGAGDQCRRCGQFLRWHAGLP
jgi:hypothetical protein